MIHSCIASLERPVLIFVNPAAGAGKAVSFVPPVRSIFEEFGIPAEFVQTDSAVEMAALAQKAVGEGRKLLVVMGGDGTLQELVNAIYGLDVVVGVLPVGGGNDFAAALNLPKNVIEATRAMLNGEPRWVDLLRARMADGQERLYVGGGGVGLDAEAAQYAGKTFRRVPGRIRYVASALTALWRFRSLRVTATFPESDLPTVESNTLLAAVLNTSTYGAGLCLAPEALPDDGLLDVVLVQNLHWIEVLQLLPRLIRTGELRTTSLKRIRAQSVRLSTDRICKFHGDGEVLGNSPVEISVVSRAVQILAPSRG